MQRIINGSDSVQGWRGRQHADRGPEHARKAAGPRSGGSAAIETQLRKAILEGSYDYGERLPAERDLAEHFGASRSTVREALRRLEEARLVTGASAAAPS